MLRLRSNAVFKLQAPIIVRIATAPNAADRLPAVLAVTRWLAERGFPTVHPADEITDQPVTLAGITATFWRYIPTGNVPVSTGELGRILRDLHRFPAPPFPVRTLTDPLASVRTSVHQHPGVLDTNEQSWLRERIADLTDAWNALPFTTPPALVHADAWIDNLLRHQNGHAVLSDWDSVAIGPREWDLIHSYHGQRRFGLSPTDVDTFAAAYGHDLRDWPGYESLMQIRDLYAIGIHIRNAPGDPFSRRELGRRLTSLKNETTHDRWHMKDI
ncbi:aminoglycoside phosphotransferase family protein [Actinomadura sp. 9N407]|uniref:aminoglycoside phosphotransferase family protein n=1 Tax=Actinomadura sp. 9N407 TaxID=3375154 RepID=UPI00379932F0